MKPKTQQVNLLPLFLDGVGALREGIRTFTLIFIKLFIGYQIVFWIGKHLQ